MRIFILLFTMVMVTSLLFCLYFILAPVFSPFRFEGSGMESRSILSYAGYYNAGWAFLIIFCVTAVCLTWLVVTSERVRKV